MLLTKCYIPLTVLPHNDRKLFGKRTAIRHRRRRCKSNKPPALGAATVFLDSGVDPAQQQQQQQQQTYRGKTVVNYKRESNEERRLDLMAGYRPTKGQAAPASLPFFPRGMEDASDGCGDFVTAFPWHGQFSLDLNKKAGHAASAKLSGLHTGGISKATPGKRT